MHVPDSVWGGFSAPEIRAKPYMARLQKPSERPGGENTSHGFRYLNKLANQMNGL
jgi:hypothetical protein